MRPRPRLLLLSGMLLCAGCSDDSTRTLNRVSKQIIDGAKGSKQSLADGVQSVKNMEMPELPDAPQVPTKEGLSEASDAFVEKVSTATAEKVVTKMGEKVDSQVDGVKEMYDGTTRSVRRTTDTARAKVRWVARKMPRSEREAQQLVLSYSEDWTKQIQNFFESLGGRGAFVLIARRTKTRSTVAVTNGANSVTVDARAAALQAYIDFYQSLRPDTVAQLSSLVSADVYFKDPFNEVRGVAAYQHILRDMFTRCTSPQFTVERVALDGEIAFLRWRFEFGLPVRRIEGVSELTLGSDGRVCRHVDYWDTSSQLLESIPVLGLILAALRRRLSAR